MNLQHTQSKQSVFEAIGRYGNYYICSDSLAFIKTNQSFETASIRDYIRLSMDARDQIFVNEFTLWAGCNYPAQLYQWLNNYE